MAILFCLFLYYYMRKEFSTPTCPRFNCFIHYGRCEVVQVLMPFKENK